MSSELAAVIVLLLATALILVIRHASKSRCPRCNSSNGTYEIQSRQRDSRMTKGRYCCNDCMHITNCDLEI